jgi:hypothetical protein
MSTKDKFLAECEAFIAASVITASAFGRKSLGDPSFITRLRRGADVSANTMDKVRAFMQQNEVLSLL